MSLTDAPSSPEQPPKSKLGAVLPYTTVALIIAILYVAWIFYSRHESARQAEGERQAKAEEARKNQVALVYGSGEIKFSLFSADNGVVRPGQTTELCYGVANAKTVRLDPPVESIQPSNHHCLEIAPKTTTTYKITAEDGKGNSKSESLTVQVK